MQDVIRLVCPECDAVHRVKSITLGKLYRCKKCKAGLITMSPAVLACPSCGATTPPAHVEVSRLTTCQECEDAPLMTVRFAQGGRLTLGDSEPEPAQPGKHDSAILAQAGKSPRPPEDASAANPAGAAPENAVPPHHPSTRREPPAPAPAAEEFDPPLPQRARIDRPGAQELSPQGMSRPTDPDVTNLRQRDSERLRQKPSSERLVRPAPAAPPTPPAPEPKSARESTELTQEELLAAFPPTPGEDEMPPFAQDSAPEAQPVNTPRFRRTTVLVAPPRPVNEDEVQARLASRFNIDEEEFTPHQPTADLTPEQKIAAAAPASRREAQPQPAAPARPSSRCPEPKTQQDLAAPLSADLIHQIILASQEPLRRELERRSIVPVWVPVALALLLFALFGWLLGELDSLREENKVHTENLARQEKRMLQEQAQLYAEKQKLFRLLDTSLLEKKRLENDLGDLIQKYETLEKQKSLLGLPGPELGQN